MATVHLGRALGAGGFERLVAIKVMHPHIASEPDFVDMFLDEGRLAARVRHPNVVATIDIQEDPLFLVMEYVEGPTLFMMMRELRKKSEQVPLAIGVRIFLDALAGLHAAHELTGPDGDSLDLIHRDISPQNILVGVDGIARITDFGVARAASRLSSTRGGQVKGKLMYMAPEQVQSAELDRRVDVYAAGAVFWEMLTGQPLFKADNDAGILAKILHGPSVSPGQFGKVPVGIDGVCMRALKQSPKDRFASAADFSDALEEAAKKDNVSIATPRAVAAFVKELKLHKPADVPAAPASGKGQLQRGAPPAPPSRPRAVYSPKGREGAAGEELEVETVEAPVADLPAPITNASRIGEPASSSPTPATGSTRMGLLLPSSAPPRAGRGVAAVAVIAAVAGGLAIGYFVVRGSSKDAAAQPSATSVAATAPLAVSVSAARVASTVTTSAAAPAAPSVLDSASAATSESAAPTTSAGPRITATSPAQNKPPPRPNQSLTSFRPEGL